VRPDAARVSVSVVKQATTAGDAASRNATTAAAVIAAISATNTIEAVAADPALVGRVIDTAIAAGASRVDSVRLLLRDEEPPRAQALRVASQRARARSRADAIALGLGVRLGQILNVAGDGPSVLPRWPD
jgi:uncharacterized protein YggE